MPVQFCCRCCDVYGCKRAISAELIALLILFLLFHALPEFLRRQEEEEEYQRQLDMLGGVWSFGSGYSGQLGHGDLESSGTPRIIKKLRGKGISQVYAVILFPFVVYLVVVSSSNNLYF